MWTYINHHETDDGYCPIDEEGLDKLPWPAAGTACRGFDALRWAEVVAYSERGGTSLAMLDPNCCDDCNIIAFAPLNEALPPDEALIKNAYPWGPCYPRHDAPKLWLEVKQIEGGNEE